MVQDISKQVLVVLGFIENAEGKILMTRRFEPTFPAAHLKWDVVGGRVELGESPKETLAREIKEEIDVEVHVGDLVPEVVSYVWEKADGEKVHTILVAYRCVLVSGEPKLIDSKMDKMEWVEKDKIRTYDLLETFYPFLQYIEK